MVASAFICTHVLSSPSPPNEAGPPNGAVTMGNVLAVLAQVGLACA